MKPKKRLVIVKWIDAVSNETGWKPINEHAATAPEICWSVGWIVKKTKGYISLVSSVGKQDADGHITIPTGMVVEIKDLQERS